MAAIEVQNLKKYYRETQAVDGISFSVENGEVFGLLGPNGAGKTTTIEIIEGMRVPDAGTVHVLGMDVTKHTNEVKGRIGVQLQNTALFTRCASPPESHSTLAEVRSPRPKAARSACACARTMPCFFPSG